MSSLLERLRAKNASSGGQGQKGGGRGSKPERLDNGSHLIQLMPFKHVLTAQDMERGLADPSEYKPGDTLEDLSVTTRTHFKPEIADCHLYRRWDGTWGGTCELCDTARDLEDAGREMRASSKFVVNVVYYDDENKGTHKVLALPNGFEKWLSEKLKSRKYAKRVPWDVDGAVIEVNVDKSAPPASMYSYEILDKEDGPSDSAKQAQAIVDRGLIKDLHADKYLHPPQFRDEVPVPPAPKVEEDKELNEAVEALAPAIDKLEEAVEEAEKKPARKKRASKKKASRKKKPAWTAGQKVLVDDEEEDFEATITEVNEAEQRVTVVDSDMNQFLAEFSELKALTGE